MNSLSLFIITFLIWCQICATNLLSLSKEQCTQYCSEYIKTNLSKTIYIGLFVDEKLFESQNYNQTSLFIYYYDFINQYIQNWNKETEEYFAIKLKLGNVYKLPASFTFNDYTSSTSDINPDANKYEYNIRLYKEQNTQTRGYAYDGVCVFESKRFAFLNFAKTSYDTFVHELLHGFGIKHSLMSRCAINGDYNNPISLNCSEIKTFLTNWSKFTRWDYNNSGRCLQWSDFPAVKIDKLYSKQETVSIYDDCDLINATPSYNNLDMSLNFCNLNCHNLTQFRQIQLTQGNPCRQHSLCVDGNLGNSYFCQKLFYDARSFFDK